MIQPIAIFAIPSFRIICYTFCTNMLILLSMLASKHCVSLCLQLSCCNFFTDLIHIKGIHHLLVLQIYGFN
jgi:hypothetical protein